MNKGLKALNSLFAFIDSVKSKFATDDYHIIEKELKALEIIKRKLPPSMRSEFLYYCDEEEYNLLKEVGL